jgi:hypothetical protein
VILRATFLMLALSVVISGTVSGQDGFTKYADPAGRFTFDYPTTMTLKTAGENEVKIFHPAATLRISVFIQDRQKKGPVTAETVADLFRKLKQEMKDSSILEEGKIKGLDGTQGYTILLYKDHRGLQLVQLVQYYIADERVLQMVISDRTEGFKNLEKVIRKIHNSLKILKPSL